MFRKFSEWAVVYAIRLGYIKEEEQEEERPEGKPHRSEQDDIDGDGRDDFGNARQAGPQIVGVERLSGVE